jgi:flavodoxin
MKKATILIATTIMIMASCGNQNPSQMDAQCLKDKKILVVYFSSSKGGNTRHMAQQIQTATKADIFEILPVNPYQTDDDKALVEQAKVEINNKYKPAIKGTVENFDQYDIIMIGSPNWWETFAPPVATFLSNYDFSGKIIMPFMTHEGSRLGRMISDVKELCPNATITSGLAIRGRSVRDKSTADEIDKWLRDNRVK